jgi:uncharacterized membrane protein YcjF (UPF0283 family)
MEEPRSITDAKVAFISWTVERLVWSQSLVYGLSAGLHSRLFRVQQAASSIRNLAQPHRDP